MWLYCIKKKSVYVSHTEDGLIIADRNLQTEIQDLAPDTFSRMVERKKIISELINFQFPDEILLISDLSCILNPFMADVSTIFAVE